MLCLFVLVGLYACSLDSQDESSPRSEQQAEQDTLYKQMMAIHDEVMPEMDRIFRLQRLLMESVDSLELIKKNKELLQKINDCKQAKGELLQAEEAMMDWMRSNDFEFENMTQQEIICLLQTEKDNIIVVKEKMLNSIQKAEHLLQNI